MNSLTKEHSTITIDETMADDLRAKGNFLKEFPMCIHFVNMLH